MALGSTQPLTEMSTRNISWGGGGKGGRYVGLTTLPPSCADCLEILEASTSWNPQGLLWPVMGLLYLLPKSNKIFAGGHPRRFRDKPEYFDPFCSSIVRDTDTLCFILGQFKYFMLLVSNGSVSGE
jgi:hypothetical protein